MHLAVSAKAPLQAPPGTQHLKKNKKTHMGPQRARRPLTIYTNQIKLATLRHRVTGSLQPG